MSSWQVSAIYHQLMTFIIATVYPIPWQRVSTWGFVIKRDGKEIYSNKGKDEEDLFQDKILNRFIRSYYKMPEKPGEAEATGADAGEDELFSPIEEEDASHDQEEASSPLASSPRRHSKRMRAVKV